MPSSFWAVTEQWTITLQQEAIEKSSLQFLMTDLCAIGYIHPIWEDRNAIAIDKATVKAQLLVRRYPLATSPTAGANRSNICPLCKLEDETPAHFLLYCPAMAKERKGYLNRVLNTCRTYRLSIDPIDIVKVILDSNHLPVPDARFEEMTRNMVFKLHGKRSVLLGSGSVFKLARKRHSK